MVKKYESNRKYQNWISLDCIIKRFLRIEARFYLNKLTIAKTTKLNTINTVNNCVLALCKSA